MNYSRYVPTHLEGIVPTMIPTQPPVRHMIPVRAYLIPEIPHFSIESRAIFMNPTIPTPHYWGPAPPLVLQYGFTAASPYNACSQRYSAEVNNSVPLQKHRKIKPAETRTPCKSSKSILSTPKEKLTESSRNQRNQLKSPQNCTFSISMQKRHDRKQKSVQTTEKCLTKEMDSSQSEKFNHKNYRQNYDLSPEILSEWRKNLKKSKESFDVPRVKIEICLKNEVNLPLVVMEHNLTKEEQKTSSLQCNLGEDGKQRMKPKETSDKMSSSNNENVEVSAAQEDLNSPMVSPKKSKLSLSEDKSSFLKFKPSQVHRKQKVDSISRKLQKRNLPRPSNSITSESSVNTSFTSPAKSNLSTEEGSLFSSRKTSITTLESLSSKYDSDNDSNESSSSVYITPESTPSKEIQKKQSPSFKRCLSDEYKDDSEMPDLKRNSSFKRSLSNEYKDDNETPFSSFHDSPYYTPESSPRTPVKRQKTRWSDSRSSYSPVASPFLNWRQNIQVSSDNSGIQPELIGYQMVGDSQFCRFGQQLLGLERVPMPNCPGRIGICVSGQTITDLHKRVREKFYPISDKIILMIGTNDFLRNVCVDVMCRELSALVNTLQKSVSKIILLTLPPIPKLEKKLNSNHFKHLEVYNRHIRSLENGDKLRIADISPLYIDLHPYKHCKMHLFEMYFGGPAKRFDLIHLNRSGLDVIRKYILEKFILN